MAKVYVFMANGFEEVEGITIVDLLRRTEIETVMVSITGDLYVTGSHDVITKADALFEEVDFSDADMLVLPGGMPGTNYLMEHDGLDCLLKEFFSKGKQLAAICAAPMVLGSKGLLKGKKATCYPGCEGALLGAQPVNSSVVEDGNIITSKGPATSIDFSLALIKSLAGEAKAEEVAKELLYFQYN